MRRLRKFGKRVTQRGIALAWGSWVGALQDRRRQGKLLARIVNRQAVKAINHWVDVAYQTRRLARYLKRMMKAESGSGQSLDGINAFRISRTTAVPR